MRPFGVTLICLYQALRALIGVVFGFFIAFYIGPANVFLLQAGQGNTVEQFIGQLGHEAGLVIVGVALVHLLAGYGLLRMRTWARLLTLLLSALELVLVIPSALHANSFSLCFGALNALCIFYLAMPPVRRCFKLPATA